MKAELRLHRSIFLAEVKKLWPELREKINAQSGLLFCEVLVVMQFLQRMIDDGERSEDARIIELINRYYLLGNKTLAEVLELAICEDVTFADSKQTLRSWALFFLCEQLLCKRAGWVKFLGVRG